MDGSSPDPAPNARWEIWHQDTFDRNVPRAREASGCGLQSGLVELWSRHLREGVDREGRATFSRFNLWWPQASRSVTITGDRTGTARLRRWLGIGRVTDGSPDEAQPPRQLLRRVVHTHCRLLLTGRDSAPILDLARSAADPAAFTHGLNQLADKASGPMPV
jgi:hypothetical protein